MLFWKIFLAVDLLLTAGYWRAVWMGSERLRRSDLVTIPIGIIGTLAVVIYAFSLESTEHLLWRLFLPVFVASGAWEIAGAASKDRFEAGTFVGVALTMLIVGITAIAIYRLGGSEWIGTRGV